jgi:PhnB protein
MSTSPAPSVVLSLTVLKAADALAFYAKAFGAQELYRMESPDGGVDNAEFIIGNTKIYISDESPEYHAFAMPAGTSASCLFYITTENCDQSYAQALEAGATALMPPADQFWGARHALIRDPFGYRWSFSQKLEEVSHQEIEKRASNL